MDARGFPGMADVDSSLLLFARKIAPQARFVLSGECGDEVFGGYPWFRDAHSLNAESFPWSGSLELRAGVLKRRVREKLDIREYVRETLADAVARVEHTAPRERRRPLPAHHAAPVLCLFHGQFAGAGAGDVRTQPRGGAHALCRRAADAIRLQCAVGDEVHGRAGEGAFARGRGRAASRKPALPQEEPLPQDLRPRIRPHRLRHDCRTCWRKRKARILQLADARALEKPGGLRPLPHADAVVRAADGRAADAGLPLAGERLACATGTPRSPCERAERPDRTAGAFCIRRLFNPRPRRQSWAAARCAYRCIPKASPRPRPR